LQRTDVVAREVRIRARPETVFEFFTDPEEMTRWKGIGAELDSRPGGSYRIQVSPRDVAAGGYIEIDPPHRIVMTWGWEGDENVPPGSSTVEVTFSEDGNETVVRVEHRDLPAGAGEVHAEGWEHFLPRLATAAEGGDPGPDPWAQ
jgi:uncharacterized protein YndB with AHSA1/START domain